MGAYYHAGFVTIKIFARTEPLVANVDLDLSFVTIKIFARTELAIIAKCKQLEFCYHKDFC